MVRLTPRRDRANVGVTGSPFTAFGKPILQMGFLAFGAANPQKMRWTFRLIFAYAVSMFVVPTNRSFVVTCKRCQRDVPSGLTEFPFQSVVVECPLCGEKRHYVPSEVFLGKPDHLVAHQARTRAR